MEIMDVLLIVRYVLGTCLQEYVEVERYMICGLDS